MAAAHRHRPRSGRRTRSVLWAAAAVTGAVVLAGCANAVDGTGNGANPIVSTAPDATSPSITGFPSGTPTTSAPSHSSAGTGLSTGTGAMTSGSVPSPSLPTASVSAPSSGTLAPSSGAANGGTCVGADYCDGFSDKTSGWDTTSENDYTIGYSAHGGGSYLVQSRYDGVIYSTAPVDVTTFAPDYDVRVDADAEMVTPGAAPEVGLRCWGHNASNGGNAGFSGYLSPTTASITLRSEAGKIVPLKSKILTSGLPVDGTSVHIALACLQTKAADGTVEADIAFAVNGKLVLETTYSRAKGHYRWATGKDAGLLLGDQGAKGYFDNVSITHVVS